jgi:hypothetical protein
MDTTEAFARGQAAKLAGNKQRVFDWDKAAQILKERGVQEADAGLQNDLEYTGGQILRSGQPDTSSYTYLSSNWATPVLIIYGEEIECWRYNDDTPGWDSDTKWPASALDIFRNGNT